MQRFLWNVAKSWSARNAATAFDAPIAVVSLLYDDKQMMPASSGMSFCCMPCQKNFCRYAVDSGEVFEICDPLADPRFVCLPVVAGEPTLRYRLGALSRPPGVDDAGALCIVDIRARRAASIDELACLSAFGRQVGNLLERHLGIDSDLAA